MSTTTRRHTELEYQDVASNTVFCLGGEDYIATDEYEEWHEAWHERLRRAQRLRDGVSVWLTPREIVLAINDYQQPKVEAGEPMITLPTIESMTIHYDPTERQWAYRVRYQPHPRRPEEETGSLSQSSPLALLRTLRRSLAREFVEDFPRDARHDHTWTESRTGRSYTWKR